MMLMIGSKEVRMVQSDHLSGRRVREMSTI
jgi:hypothetical protein